MRYVVAIRTASSAASKQSAGERGATIGTGASPLRPNIACSRSACSVFVGSPVLGPPRWTSTTTSGSSSETASPIVSLFRARPGPEVVRDGDGAAVRGAEGHADGRDLVLGLQRRDAEALEPAEGVQDVGGGGDRVRAEHERQPGPVRGGDEAVGQRDVAGDVPVDPGRRRCGRHLVLDGEVLGRLAEGPAGLERLEVGCEQLRLGAELLLQEAPGRLGRPAVEPREHARARTCSWRARPPCG